VEDKMRHFGFTKLFIAALFAVAIFALSVDVSEARRDKGHHDAIEGEADHLVVKYTKAVVKPDSGKRIVFVFDPAREVDLLTLGPDASHDILGDVLPEGHYKSIRLDVVAKKDTLDSYIEISGDTHSIWMPNGKKRHRRGLKLSRGFDVSSDGTADFSVAFDLSRNVHRPKGHGDNLVLRPKLRLTESVVVAEEVVEEVIEPGSIGGVVNISLLTAANCGRDFAIYLFTGLGTTPVDIDGIAPEPMARVGVGYDAALASYAYSFASVEPGDYTVAFTCQVMNDYFTTDDAIVFSAVGNASVGNGADVVVNFE
jgi:hypothetical protein